MQENNPLCCSAFCGSRLIASGRLRDVALTVKTALGHEELSQTLIFDDATSHVVEVDFRGSADEVLARLEQTPDEAPAAGRPAPRGPGRPKLGVVAREVTLLPRHWDWLNGQPGGASVALRKLVEEARRANQAKDRIRNAQDVTFRFMSAMAGNELGFEEAVRALFAANRKRFSELTEAWPPDIRDHAKKLASPVFEPTGEEPAPAHKTGA
jgi:uncharacterized protein